MIAGHLYDINKSVAGGCLKVLSEAGCIGVGLFSSKNRRMVLSGKWTDGAIKRLKALSEK